jgi:predicted metalloprotease with PDZ domain
MQEYPDLRAAVQDSAVVSVAGFRQAMIDLNLRGPDLNQLVRASDQVMQWMRQDREYGFVGVAVDGAQGVTLTMVRPTSPADLAGLRRGDVVTAVGQQTARLLAGHAGRHRLRTGRPAADRVPDTGQQSAVRRYRQQPVAPQARTARAHRPREGI